MEMTYRQLEKTLVSYFHILPDRESTFRSRIKQLQRLEFPTGINVGRGVKMTYNGAHLFKMVVAFELIALGFPAQTATQIVERHWNEFAAAFSLASLASRWETKELGLAKSDKIYIELALRSLFEIQFASSGWGDPEPSAAYIEDGEYLRGIYSKKAESPSSDPRPRLILCISDILLKTLKIAKEQAGIASSTVYNGEIVGWLPDKDSKALIFMRGLYPDRSNLKMRQRLHRLYGNDPECETEEGRAEANKFARKVFGDALEF